MSDYAEHRGLERLAERLGIEHTGNIGDVVEAINLILDRLEAIEALVIP